MKYMIIFISTIMSFASGFAQAVSSEVLSEPRIEELFPEAVRSGLNISFQIVQVHRYTDRSGSYYYVLTESRNGTFDDQAFGDWTP